MQKSVTQFISQCERAKVYVENDMPIGVFHDFLMELKGLMVDRMVAAHQEQVQQTEAAKSLPLHESELSAIPDLPSCCGKE
jgi:hypothetical protein